MSALAELHAGAAGPAFVAELQRTLRAVGVARNFPPPEGHSRWDGAAVQSATAEFLSDAQTPRRLADLALHCADEHALRARLQGAVRNFLADLGRRTPVGKLVVRINDVLSSDAGFVRVGGRWGLAGGPDGPGADDPDGLARAILGVDVVVPAWGHEAARTAPVANRASIASLCRRLLEAAGGTLTVRSLARAIGHRLGLGQAPLSLEVDGLDPPAGPVPGLSPAAHDSTGAAAVRQVRAVEVLGLLGDRERLAVAFPEYSVRELGPVLGTGPSQSHLVRRRAVETIRAELVDDDDAEAVALLVLELARTWAEEADTGAGSAVLVGR
ncbi:MAG TPA: hypothetical protein VM263_07850 [Acidimicrobiales bacterium]|nr:hypothetical protein [Acidimicrobiales bacterium]